MNQYYTEGFHGGDLFHGDLDYIYIFIYLLITDI